MTDVHQVAARHVWQLMRGRVKSLGAVLALVPLLCALPAYVVFQNWVESTSLKHEWTFKGPPCPVVAQPSPVATRRHKPPTTFDYHEVSFTRSFGGASCGSVPENPLWPSVNYRVCRFNNPGAVVVEQGGQRTIFEPGPGQPATVTVRGGRASCVVAGWFSF
jgi:hypothetical protein